MGTSLLRKDIFFTSFDGGEGILVDLNTKHYYRLNETGAVIWKALEAGRSVDDIVRDLQALYEVASDHARASIHRLLHSLEANKLIESDQKL